MNNNNNDKFDSDDNFWDLNDDIREEEPETFEVHVPANDNATPRPRRSQKFGPSPYKRERVALVLAKADFDPEKIPLGDRVTALHIAGCFDKKIFDEHVIAECVQRPVSTVRRVIDHLRAAAKPGKVVG